MTTKMEPVRMGTAGLRHYAAYVCQLLEKYSARPDAELKLVSVCRTKNSPPETVDRLRNAGVRIVDSFDDLLNEPIEALWVPFPIHLHREFTEKALAAGKAVMCEKPVAGCVDDLDAMIAAEKKAGRPVVIGYQDIYNPSTMILKKRILNGDIGTVRRFVTYGAGPRGDKYFNRSGWPGKFQADGRWILDCIANNAHAHEINLMMFLAGRDLNSAAQPVSVEAELYRGNPIETFDTASLRLKLDTGIELLVLLTHSCEFFVDSTQVIEGSRGRILRTRGVSVIESNGKREVLRPDTDVRDTMVQRFARAVRGVDDPEIGLATLQTSRGQTVAVNGAVEAAPIVNIPESARRVAKTNQGVTQATVGMEAMLRLCARLEVMMHESGLFPWTVPAVRKDLHGYRHFAGPVRK